MINQYPWGHFCLHSESAKFAPCHHARCLMAQTNDAHCGSFGQHLLLSTSPTAACPLAWHCIYWCHGFQRVKLPCINEQFGRSHFTMASMRLIFQVSSCPLPFPWTKISGFQRGVVSILGSSSLAATMYLMGLAPWIHWTSLNHSLLLYIVVFNNTGWTRNRRGHYGSSNICQHKFTVHIYIYILQYVNITVCIYIYIYLTMYVYGGCAKFFLSRNGHS